MAEYIENKLSSRDSTTEIEQADKLQTAKQSIRSQLSKFYIKRYSKMENLDFYLRYLDLDADIDIHFEKDKNVDILTLDDLNVDMAELEHIEKAALDFIPPVSFIPNDEETVVDQKMKKFVCESCSRNFKSQNNLSRHRRKTCPVLRAEGKIVDPASSSGDASIVNKIRDVSLEDFRQFFVDSIKDASNDVAFNFLEPGFSSGLLAQEIIKSAADTKTIADMFIRNVVPHIHEIASQASLKCEQREKMFSKLYNFSLNADIYQSWDSFLMSLNLQFSFSCSSSVLLLQYIVDRVYYQIIKHFNLQLKESCDEIQNENLDLSEKDERTIRYVSGYIPYTMKKKTLKQKDSPEKEALLQIFDSWSKHDEESIETDSSEKWQQEINRGGLFTVSDDFYIFIRHIEIVARSVLNVHYMKEYEGENIRSLLLSKFCSSERIDRAWHCVVRNIENESIKKSLQEEIFSKWINIRGNSFVKCWVDQLKKSQIDERKSGKNLQDPVISKGGSGSRGLRKHLPQE